jgi:hypothetical protein
MASTTLVPFLYPIGNTLPRYTSFFQATSVTFTLPARRNLQEWQQKGAEIVVLPYLFGNWQPTGDDFPTGFAILLLHLSLVNFMATTRVML